ncbi:hypothetical protein ACMDCT_04495 [Halomonadaceae bacterium KBTZ08]
MELLTEDADLRCAHDMGKVAIIPGQNWVRVNNRCLLVERDPEGRPIAGCPNAGPTIKPCTATLPVETGYSSLVRINGRRVCLDTVTGLTDGTPPGTVKYDVHDSGQHLARQVRP